MRSFQYVTCAMGFLMFCAAPTLGQHDTRSDSNHKTFNSPVSFSLASHQEQPDSTAHSMDSVKEEAGDNSWNLIGPFDLRSADPEPVGELEIKNILGYAREESDEEEWEYELEIEYGLIENHELLLIAPFELGEGRIEGNGDVTLGWHWRLWEENGDWPAFAMRNFARIPTGIDSSGVDYRLIGLFTKTIIPNQLRFEFNPFLASINGDNDEEAEDFQWGAVAGFDYRVADDTTFIASYKYADGENENAPRGNHTAEFGLDWYLSEMHRLGFSVQVGLDGDDYGTEIGGKISYIIALGEE